MKNPADILAAFSPSGKEGDVQILSGALESTQERVKSAQEVLTKFQRFGGQGWLCLSSTPVVLRYRDAATLENVEGWPLFGEAVKDDTSLHLRREKDGWNLLQIRRIAPSCEHDLLIRSSFCARDRGKLYYETFWKLQDVGGQEELRPWAFRFTGFDTFEKEV